MKHRFPSLLALLCLLAFPVILPAQTQPPAKPVVFVSIPPQAWLMRSLTGDRFDIRTLLPDNANPHTFEPTAKQLKTLSGAALYVSQGGIPFEDNLLPKITALNPKLKTFAMSWGIAKRPAEHHHDHHHAGHHHTDDTDPHIWLAPGLFAGMASNTVHFLCETFPDQRETWEAALPKTCEIIRTADRELREKRAAATCDTWVIYHPAWDYLTDAYNLKALVIEQEGKAPSARHLAEVLRAAQAAKAKTVMIGPQNNPRPAQWIADQLGGRLVTVNPLQEDWPALMRQIRDLME